MLKLTMHVCISSSSSSSISSSSGRSSNSSGGGDECTHNLRAPRLSEDSALCTEETPTADVQNGCKGHLEEIALLSHYL